MQEPTSLTSQELRTAIEDLVDANHILADQGVVDGFGHISARHPEDPTQYLLARAVAPEQVAADDIMAFDLESEPIDARGRIPYRERFIHGEIYKARPDVNSVINAHSPWILSFAANRVPLRPIHNKAAFLAPATPIFDLRDQFGATDMLLTTPAQAQALAQALRDSAVVLLRGHGHVAVGQSVKVAVFRAYYAEFNARLQARAMALPGTTVFIEGEEAEKADRTMQQVDERPWALWKSKARSARGR
jgi:ribulose-5-phosphate 4-epimerase/fuculose-1-phosphate aldolase